MIARSDCSQLPRKTTEEDQEEVATAWMLQCPYRMAFLHEKKNKTWHGRLSSGGKNYFNLRPTGFGKSVF